MKFDFPLDFLWGSACSSGQLEGSSYADGKGPNVWDHYSKTRPDLFKDASPDNCADFYTHYKDDIKLMKEMGMKIFRFSIAWARIFPEGPDKLNQKGIDYYNDLINTFTENGIKLMLDLFHCDLPMWVIDKGGIKSREFIGWFTKYAKVCFDSFGDRVYMWSTVNEPSLNVFAAYSNAFTGPYEKDFKAAVQASHNMLIAHFRTVKMYHSMNFGGKIGAVNYIGPYYTNSLDPADEAAAMRGMDDHSGWWVEPMMTGKYPESLVCYPKYAENMPENYAAELEYEFEKMDYIGINYYNPFFAVNDDKADLGFAGYADSTLPVDEYGFVQFAPGLYDTVMFLKEKYGNPEMYITENGVSMKREKFEEPTSTKDPYRIKHMREHMRACARCIQSGANLKGYMNWTIMDTYEGAAGYTCDFGLIQVDFVTKKRTPRDSYYFYSEVIKRNKIY